MEKYLGSGSKDCVGKGLKMECCKGDKIGIWQDCFLPTPIFFMVISLCIVLPRRTKVEGHILNMSNGLV